ADRRARAHGGPRGGENPRGPAPRRTLHPAGGAERPLRHPDRGPGARAFPGPHRAFLLCRRIARQRRGEVPPPRSRILTRRTNIQSPAAVAVPFPSTLGPGFAARAEAPPKGPINAALLVPETGPLPPTAKDM